MTAKEAIASLKTLCHTCELFPKCVHEKPECFKAIELAISALQAQEANHSTESSLTQKALDTISRQAAIDALRVMQTYKLCEGDDMLLIDQAEAQAELMMLPSAQPEHMHTVMLKIKEKYEKAMNTPCINNPIAWALYQTWKEYDR